MLHSAPDRVLATGLAVLGVAAAAARTHLQREPLFSVYTMELAPTLYIDELILYGCHRERKWPSTHTGYRRTIQLLIDVRF